MRVATALCALALGLLGGGCSLVEQAASTTAYRAHTWLDDCAEQRRDRRWAEAAWKEVRRAEPTVNRSKDYAQGFKDGFVHLLYEGGSGEPPPLPPSPYRALTYQTPQGYRAIEDWFAGFRHGATVAEEQGYRRWVTGPSSLRPRDDPDALAFPPAELLTKAAPPPAGEDRPRPTRVVRARQPVLPPPAPPPVAEESEPVAPADPGAAWSRANDEPPPRPIATVIADTPGRAEEPPRAPPPILWRRADPEGDRR